MPNIAKNETYTDVFDRYTLYRSSKIGISLIQILLYLYRKNKIKTYLIFKILNKVFVYSLVRRGTLKYMFLLLKKKINCFAKIRGYLYEYNHIDDIWMFSVNYLQLLMDLPTRKQTAWRVDVFVKNCSKLKKKPLKHESDYSEKSNKFLLKCYLELN